MKRALRFVSSFFPTQIVWIPPKSRELACHPGAMKPSRGWVLPNLVWVNMGGFLLASLRKTKWGGRGCNCFFVAGFLRMMHITILKLAFDAWWMGLGVKCLSNFSPILPSVQDWGGGGNLERLPSKGSERFNDFPRVGKRDQGNHLPAS